MNDYHNKEPCDQNLKTRPRYWRLAEENLQKWLSKQSESHG